MTDTPLTDSDETEAFLRAVGLNGWAAGGGGNGRGTGRRWGGVIGCFHAGKRGLAGSFGHCGRKYLGPAKTGHKMLMGGRRVNRQSSMADRWLRVLAGAV